MTKATRNNSMSRARKSTSACQLSAKEHSVKPRGRASTPKPHVVETRITTPIDSAKVTRKAALLALLTRPNGAELSELVAATGWQVHSVRAALTHFRQAGHVVTRSHHEGSGSRYTVAVAG